MTNNVTDDAGPLEPGEGYYTRWGWSGCAGSAWATLSPAVKDGWRHAEEAQGRANALAGVIDRCTGHLRVVLGYADSDRDAGLESLAVQAKYGAADARVAARVAALADDEAAIRRVGTALYGAHSGEDFTTPGSIPRQTAQAAIRSVAAELTGRAGTDG